MMGVVNGFGAWRFRAELVRGATIHFVSRLVSLAMGIVLARGLGAEGYGIYGSAFAIFSIALLVAELGLPTLVLREISSTKARGEWATFRGLLIDAGRLPILAASAFSGVAIAYIHLIDRPIAAVELDTLTLTFLMLPLAAAVRSLAAALKGMGQNSWGQFTELLLAQLLVTSMVTIAFLLFPGTRTASTAMGLQLGATFITLLTIMWQIRARQPQESRAVKPDFQSISWIKRALPFVLVNGGLLLNTQVDILLIAWLRSDQEVGIYRVATQGAILTSFGLQVVNIVAAPHFARLHALGDKAALRRTFRIAQFVAFSFALAATGAFFLLGKDMIALAFGAEYSSSFLPLVTLCVGFMVNAACGPVGVLLAMTGHERTVSRILWVTALVNVVLSLMLINAMGLVGVAIATSVSLSLFHLLFIRAAKRHLGV